ncbi:MAG: TlpA family protein disulfide reductase [Bacteroidales bacterium]
MKTKKKSAFTLGLLSALILMLAISSCTTSSSNKNGGVAVINGKWDRKDEGVSLFKIVDGRLEEISSTIPTLDNKFSLATPLKKEGLYVVGTKKGSMNISKYTFYFKPGDVLNVEFNDSTYTLTGDNTKENKAMEQWHNFVFPLEHNFVRENGVKVGSTYVNYFPLLEKKLEELKSLSITSTGNSTFETAFNSFKEHDFMYLAVAFNYLPRMAHPQSDDFIQYYRDLDVSKITSNASILKYPQGARLLSTLFFTTQALKGGDLKDDYHGIIKNDTLIGEMSVEQAIRFKSYQTFIDYEARESKYILTEDQKARMDAIKTRLAKDNKEGQPAVDFKYPDINGKMVALSDLKGKVVVIDVWATWCGPCKKEIPHFKKLEKEYHGKDVAFMSVSIDEEKNKQKWADFVKKEELSGIQLFAGGWNSDIAKFYNIKGIPRFIVIDKNGNLASSAAPRPSTPGLKQMINKYLNQ